MKFMATWSVKPGNHYEAYKRFLSTGGAPPEGVKVLARYHKVDMSGGFSLYESDSAVALYESASLWADLIDIQTTLVIESEEAAPVVAKMMAK